MEINERIFAKTIQVMNRHLPAKRKTLSELLKEENPRITGKDNSVNRISKKELNLLSSKIPESEWNRLKLPIIIEMTLDYATIRGKLECKIARSILKTKKGEENKIIIYMPEIRELRRALPTTTQYAFYLGIRY